MYLLAVHHETTQMLAECYGSMKGIRENYPSAMRVGGVLTP